MFWLFFGMSKNIPLLIPVEQGEEQTCFFPSVWSTLVPPASRGPAAVGQPCALAFLESRLPHPASTGAGDPSASVGS